MQWEDDYDDVRVKEIDGDEDDYDRVGLLDEYLSDPKREEDRRQRRYRNYEYEDEMESSEGDDYNLDSDADSTVAYAVQLAMMDKEERLVDKALERIRRARMLGKKNVRLSQQERDALERRRMRNEESKEMRPKKGTSSRPDLSEKRKSKGDKPTKGKPDSTERRNSILVPSGAERPQANDEVYGAWTRTRGIASGYYSTPGTRPSSSSSQRPRTPSSQTIRPLQPSTSPRHPQRYPSVSERRPTSSSSRYQAFPRPLPDDPQWMPRSRASSNTVPYSFEPAAYPSYIHMDPRYGYPTRRDVAGFPDPSYRAARKPPSDDNDDNDESSSSDPINPQHVPSESSSEESSSEDDDDDESENDGKNGVKAEAERPAATGSQARPATTAASSGRRGSGRGGRARRGRGR